MIIFQLQKSLGIKLIGVSETWFCIDFQKVQICKDFSDIAEDTQILVNGVHLQNQQNKVQENKNLQNFSSQDYSLKDHIRRKISLQ